MPDSPRVLVLTNMFPTAPRPWFGTFVADQVASLRQLGVAVDVLFIDPLQTRLNYLVGPFRLRRQLAARPYDLLHAHYVFCGAIAVTQRRVPVVVTHHGIEALAGWTAPLSRWVSRRVALTIVTSPALARHGHGDALVIPCGVDLDLFRPMSREQARGELGLPQGRRLVLFAGQPRPEKRLDIARRAVERLSGAAHDVELVVVSNQPHQRMPLWMNAADVLLLVSDQEGSPMVVKEAMACGLPIVATAVGDVEEVIGGTAGCFLCGQNADDVAAKLRDALAFGRRTEGRGRMTRFGHAAIATLLLDAYRAACSRTGHRTPGRGPSPR